MFGLSEFLKIPLKPYHSKGKYYYGRLTNEQKELYQVLLHGVEACATEIKLPLRPTNELLLVFNSILLDHPMIFYVSSFHQTSDLHKQICVIEPDYQYAKRFVKENTNTINAYLQTFDRIRLKAM